MELTGHHLGGGRSLQAATDTVRNTANTEDASDFHPHRKLTSS